MTREDDQKNSALSLETEVGFPGRPSRKAKIAAPTNGQGTNAQDTQPQSAPLQSESPAEQDVKIGSTGISLTGTLSIATPPRPDVSVDLGYGKRRSPPKTVAPAPRDADAPPALSESYRSKSIDAPPKPAQVQRSSVASLTNTTPNSASASYKVNAPGGITANPPQPPSMPSISAPAAAKSDVPRATANTSASSTSLPLAADPIMGDESFPEPNTPTLGGVTRDGEDTANLAAIAAGVSLGAATATFPETTPAASSMSPSPADAATNDVAAIEIDVQPNNPSATVESEIAPPAETPLIQTKAAENHPAPPNTNSSRPATQHRDTVPAEAPASNIVQLQAPQPATTVTHMNTAPQSPSRETAPHSAVVALRGISKSFGPVRANNDISLSLLPGERHALLGENGAGKSTLVKILYGMLQPDAGEIELNGDVVRLTSPAHARKRGVGMVFQHFASFDGLSVAENLAAALPDRSRAELRTELKEIEARYGLTLDIKRRVGTLSAGEKQRLEIVRCLMQDPRVLILDEPTSVLTPQESETLFQTLERLSEQGIAILYISHRLEDVRRLCQSATILRGGKRVGTCDPRQTSTEQLGEMMVGSRTEKLQRKPSYVGGALLTVSGLNTSKGMALKDVSLTVRRGEILGIAGVAGEGQSEFFEVLSGERLVRDGKAILLSDKPIGRLNIQQRRALGAAYAPEDRHGHAALPELTLSENLRLTFRKGGLKHAATIRDDYGVVAEGKDPYAGALSGGNLQKFLIGREIAKKPKILVAAQPTWGVDIAAAAAIHKALHELREGGAGILIFSQDLDEIYDLCDRVAVMHRGALSNAYALNAITREEIGVLMGGGQLGDTALPENKQPGNKTHA